MQNFVLRSPDFKDGEKLPQAHVHSAMGAGGSNISPELEWSGAPPGTQSFAITMYDPDAPTGSGFWHWILYNIPGSETRLPQGAGVPASASLPVGAVQGRTDFGEHAYGGAAPPPGHGRHRYVFTIYALNTKSMELPAEASAAFVGFNIHFAKIAEARLTAWFER